jgi:hypothetical protein
LLEAVASLESERGAKYENTQAGYQALSDLYKGSGRLADAGKWQAKVVPGSPVNRGKVGRFEARQEVSSRLPVSIFHQADDRCRYASTSERQANPTINHTLERNMKTTFKKIAIRALTVTAIASAAVGTANAGVFIYGPRIVVPAVYAAPVVVAPVVVAPTAVPTCRFVSMPFVNAYTGWTYMVTRRVCN